MNNSAIAAIAVLLSTTAVGQVAENAAPAVIESGSRSVTFTKAVPREQTGYDSPWHYAHAIRAGDFVYISGIVLPRARRQQHVAVHRRAGPVIAETKAQYTVEPHPAWTAVGTTGLFSPRGIVEIEIVAYAPLGPKEHR